jgi:hypothetical protein
VVGEVMLIPTGVKYWASAWGGTVKEVVCAHCGTEFVYEMRRHVESEANAALFIGMDSAKERATRGAQAELLGTLEGEHDLVACPHCERLQPAMSRQVRRMWRKAVTIGWVASLIVAFFGWMAAEASFRQAATWTIGLPIASTLGMIGGMIWLHGREFRASATDRAQRKNEAQAEGYARLGIPRVREDGWIWVRPTLFEAPAVCAGCGSAEARAILRCRLGGWFVGGVTMEAHVCATCYRSALWKRVLWGAVSFFAPVLGSVLMELHDPTWDGIDMMLWVIGGVVAGALALAAVNNWLLGRAGFPIRMRRFQVRRDELEVRFRSLAAAEEFVAGAIARMQARMAEARQDARS